MRTPVYSIAKTFTAAEVLLEFDPASPIGEHLDVPPALTGITIDDLLTHRSGLDDYFAWPEYRSAVAARKDPWETEAILDHASLGPSGLFRYSNIGYLMLRLALERRRGTDFLGSIAPVLEAVGVDARPFAVPADWHEVETDIGVVPAELSSYHPGWVYPGTFVADVGDAATGIARIMAGELGHGADGRPVADAMREALPVDAGEHPLGETMYGRGLMVGRVLTEDGVADVVGHGGGGPGYALFAGALADATASAGESGAEGQDLVVTERVVRRLTGE